MWLSIARGQKAAKRSQLRVSLAPLPVMNESFDQIYMDIVGPCHVVEEVINT